MKNKKLSTKILSFIMTFLLLAISLPIYAFASAIDTKAENEETIEETINSAQAISNELYVLEEDVTLREENAKHFKLSDGTMKAVSYAQAVHYKDENGNWIDIDNSLTLSGSEYATSNKQEIKFANKSGSNGLISIKDGEYKIDFTPLNTNKVSVEIENPEENNSRKFDDVKKLNKLVSKATYKDIYSGIDLEYILVGNNIKENIIVKEKQSEYSFSFEIKLNKLNAELENNVVVLTDSKTGEKVYEIPAPYMLDANGEYSDSVEYTLTKDSKWKYTLTVVADPSWINAEEREFPVKIDPTITTGSITKELFVMEDGVYDNLPSLIIGNFMGFYYDATGFIKFDALTGIEEDTILLDAKLLLHVPYVLNETGRDFNIGVYQATTNWYSKNITGTYNINHNNKSTYFSPTLVDEETMTETGVYSWDITGMYKEWLANSGSNHGVCIKGIDLPTENDTTVSSEIANIRVTTTLNTDGYMVPTIELSYRYLVGVEDYYAYAENTLGDVGKSYVNLYNGSLTYINNLTSIEVGENLTYDINMVYNSIDKAWTPSFYENVEPYTALGVEQYIWTDEDGTKHLFTPYLEKNFFGAYATYELSPTEKWPINDPTIFYPEDDIDYVLVQTTNNELILRDYQGNQKMFDDNGRLSKICDAQGNILFFEYSNNKLISITKRAFDNVITNQTRLNYDLDNRLCYIYDTISQKYIEIEYLVNENQEGNETLNEIKVSYSNKILSFIHDSEWNIKEAQLYSVAFYNNEIVNSQIREIYNYLDAKVNRIEQKDKYSSLIPDSNGDYSTIYETISKRYEMEYKSNGTSFKDTILDTEYEYVFDNQGRIIKIYSCDGETDEDKTLIDSPEHDDDIIPESIYFNTTYSTKITQELMDSIGEYNIVSHNISSDASSFVNFETSSSSVIQDEEVSSLNTYSEERTLSPYTIIPQDDREKVNNTTQYPYNLVCYVMCIYYGVRDNSTGEIVSRVGTATGFLVDSNVLMTAGHVVYSDVSVTDEKGNYDDGVYNPRFPNRIIVFPGAHLDENGNIETPSDDYYEVETCYIQKEYYTSCDRNYDWATCILNANFTSEQGYFNLTVATESELLNKEITIVGYPSDKDGDMYISEGKINYLYGNNMFCDAYVVEGNSGSPICTNNNATLNVYGILAFRDDDTIVGAGPYINVFIYSFVEYVKINN